MSRNKTFFNSPEGLVLPRLSGDPATGVNGEIYYDTITNTLKSYTNGSWGGVSSGANVTLSNLTSPTDINQNLTFDNTSDRSLIIENTTGAAAKNLTVKAGTAVTGSNLSAGNLILSAGAGTGVTSFEDQIQMFVAKAAGTATGATTLYKAGWIGAGSTFTRFKIAAEGVTDSNANLFFTAASSSYGISAGTPPGGTEASIPFTITALGSTTTSNAGSLISVVTQNRSGTGLSGAISMASGTTSGASGGSGTAIFQSGDSTAASSAANSGAVTIQSGNVTGSGATGGSGSLTLATGTVTSGARGSITIDGSIVQFRSSFGFNANNSYSIGDGSNQVFIYYGQNFLGYNGTTTFGSAFTGNIPVVVQSGSNNLAAVNTNTLTLQSGDQLTSGTGTVGSVTLRSGNITVVGNSNPTGNITINSGTTTGTGATGSINLTTSNSPSAASGNIKFTIGTAGTTRGLIDFNQSPTKSFVMEYGATRPGSPVDGQLFGDTTLPKLIFFFSGNWYDAMGNIV